MQKTSLQLKICLIGDSSVGKSCIINKLIKNKFQTIHDVTIHTNSFTVSAFIEKKETKIVFFDTPGQLIFKNTTISSCIDMDCIIFVYDISNSTSFHSLSRWILEIQEKNRQNCIYVILGNKLDLISSRKIPEFDANNFSKDKNFLFSEISALTGQNFKEFFQKIINETFQLKLKNNFNDLNDKNNINKFF